MYRLGLKLFSILSLLAASVAGTSAQAGAQSMPMPMGSNLPNCGLEKPAFCDTFETPYSGGGRTGELDPSRWSIGRVGNANPSQGMVNLFVPSNAMHCKDPITGLIPDKDYFICGLAYGEPNHFMEAFNDQGGYIYNDARVRQPFDFSGRTGTVTFDVDAKTSGSHGWWVELWITDQPVPTPHDNIIKAPPRNGINLEFDGTCNGQTQPGDSGADVGNVGQANIVRNYHLTELDPWHAASGGEALHQVQCYQTMPDMKNHFEVRIDQQHLEVWATDPMNNNLRQVATVDNLNLPFTRGYVHLQHAQYNAGKAAPGVTHYQTYHWGNVGFDGPVLPAPAEYSLPDSLTPGPDGGMNVGYLASKDGLKSGPLTLQNVDLSGAQAASLAFTAWIDSGQSINYRVNGGAWHTWTDPVQPQLSPWKAALAPIDLSELHSGSNSIDFAAPNGGQPFVSNIDLILDGAAGTGVSATPADNTPPPASPSTPDMPNMPAGTDMSNMPGMDMTQPGADTSNMPGMDMTQPGTDMSNMPGMDMSQPGDETP